jgi:hypothetical protein
MKLASKLMVFAGPILLLASCQEAYEQDEWVGEYTADLVEENGEPVCVDDVCAVLEMYQSCVDANPVQDVDLAVAAQVERQCDDDDGECCDMGFYMSPDAASCISDNVGTARLMYHMGHGAPIWELTDGLISEVHAANGSVLSERTAPVAS